MCELVTVRGQHFWSKIVGWISVRGGLCELVNLWSKSSVRVDQVCELVCELVNVGQLCELDKCVTSVCEVLWVRDQCARWPNISVRAQN